MILHSPNFKYNWYKLLALFYTILLSNWPNWQFLRVCTFRGNLLFSFLYFLFHFWLSETFLQENENNTGWRRAWRRAAVLYYRQSFGAEPENDEGKAGAPSVSDHRGLDHISHRTHERAAEAPGENCDLIIYRARRAAPSFHRQSVTWLRHHASTTTNAENLSPLLHGPGKSLRTYDVYEPFV